MATMRRICFLITYAPGSEPKKTLSSFYYDHIDSRDKKRIFASVIFKSAKKDKISKIHFKSKEDALRFITDDVKIPKENVILAEAKKTKGGGVAFEYFENKHELKNFKELFDLAGEKASSESEVIDQVFNSAPMYKYKESDCHDLDFQ